MIRIACLGLGWVCVHRHIPSIRRTKGLELVGVIDSHAGVAESFAKKLSLTNFSEAKALRDVPWLDKVDALAIAAPPFAHNALVTEALRLGKHVITEKPFAMTVAEGEEMVACAKEQKRILAVVHNFQFGRAAKKLFSAMEKNEFGKINSIEAIQRGNPRRRLPVWYEKLPLGLFFDESPHFFYLLRKIAGTTLDLQSARCVASSEGLQTPASVSLFYRNIDRVPVTINCFFESAVSEWYIFVNGENGLGILDIFRDIFIFLPNDNAHGLLNVIKTSACAISQHLLQHIPNGLSFIQGKLDYGNNEVFARFAQAIQTGNPPPSISCEDALDVLKLQHEAIDALKENVFA